MGTIKDKLNYLLESKALITNAIEEKGVDIPNGTPFRQYADKISRISGGDGEADISNVIDDILGFKDPSIKTIEKLNNIRDVKTDIRNSIAYQGIEVSNDLPFSKYPEKILDIEVDKSTTPFRDFKYCDQVLNNLRNNEHTFKCLCMDYDLEYSCFNYFDYINDTVLDGYGSIIIITSDEKTYTLSLDGTCFYKHIWDRKLCPDSIDQADKKMMWYALFITPVSNYSQEYNKYFQIERFIPELTTKYFCFEQMDLKMEQQEGSVYLKDYQLLGIGSINNNLVLDVYDHNLPTSGLKVLPNLSYTSNWLSGGGGYRAQGVPGIEKIQSVRPFDGEKDDGGFYFANYTDLKIVEHFDPKHLGNLSDSFTNCHKLTSIPEINLANCNTVRMYNMFLNCHSIKSVVFKNMSNIQSLFCIFENCYCLEDIQGLNVQDVESLSRAFSNCYTLKEQNINSSKKLIRLEETFINCKSMKKITFSDTSNVTLASEAFSSCCHLVTVEGLNLQNATNIYHLFCKCFSLKNIPPLSLPKITDLDSTFKHCHQLKSITLSNLDNVTNLYFTFYGCYELTAVSDLNLPKATSFEYGFENCISLVSPPKITAPKLEDCTSLFEGCTSLITVPKIEFGNTKRDITCRGMFKNCINLTDISNIDFRYVTDIEEMFKNCVSLETVPVFDITNIKNIKGLFSGCTSLKEIVDLNYTNSINIAHLYENCINLTSIDKFNFDLSYNLEYVFSGCSGITTVPEISSNYTKYVSGLFKNCIGLTSLPKISFTSAQEATELFDGCKNITFIESLELPLVTDLTYLFRNCTKIKDFNFFKASQNVKILKNTFYGCESLTTAPNILLITCEDMSGTFSYCIQLTSFDSGVLARLKKCSGTFENCHKLIDVNFDIRKSECCSQMFKNCTKLQKFIEPYIPEEYSIDDTGQNSESKNFSEMFSGCTSITHVKLSDVIYNDGWDSDVNYETGAKDMFKGCSNLETLEIIKLGTSLDLSDCTKLSTESLNNIVNSIMEANIYDPFILTLPSSLFSQITEAQKVIITNKKWRFKNAETGEILGGDPFADQN